MADLISLQVDSYSQFLLTILNRQELEAASCSCYGIIKGEYARLLDTDNG
jgi:hypothetical protein